VETEGGDWRRRLKEETGEVAGGGDWRGRRGQEEFLKESGGSFEGARTLIWGCSRGRKIRA
jgi:hypothetical protein